MSISNQTSEFFSDVLINIILTGSKRKFWPPRQKGTLSIKKQKVDGVDSLSTGISKVLCGSFYRIWRKSLIMKVGPYIHLPYMWFFKNYIKDVNEKMANIFKKQ